VFNGIEHRTIRLRELGYVSVNTSRNYICTLYLCLHSLRIMLLSSMFWKMKYLSCLILRNWFSIIEPRLLHLRNISLGMVKFLHVIPYPKQSFTASIKSRYHLIIIHLSGKRVSGGRSFILQEMIIVVLSLMCESKPMFICNTVHF
jgi:hypothetical protein